MSFSEQQTTVSVHLRRASKALAQPHPIALSTCKSGLSDAANHGNRCSVSIGQIRLWMPLQFGVRLVPVAD